MRRFPRLRWWHGALALTLCAALVGVFLFLDRDPDEPEEGPPEDAPRTLVSLGDSTLSGEGTDQYTGQTDGQDGNWCRRSAQAAIHMTAVPGVEETINLACSGSGANHVQLGGDERYTEPSQAERLADIAESHRVTGVVVAVGANDDPQFTSLIIECIQAWFGGAPCSESIAPEWEETVQSMVPKVVEALADVRTVLEDAGYEREDYELILQSYASPLSAEIPEDLRNLSGCPFTTEDLNWVSTDGVETLTDGMRDAAEQVGARFLDLSRAGEGHEACTGGDDPSSEWFTRLTVAWDDLEDADRAEHFGRASFHPNAAGHEQIGRCLSDFIPTDAQEAACLVSEDETLRAAPAVPAP